MNQSSAQSAATAQKAKFTVRWVLAHEPVSVFEKASKRFGELLRERTSGAMDVRVMTQTEFGKGEKIPAPAIVGSIMGGRLEMTQTYTPLLAQYGFEMWALDLPFLFRDHDHCTRVVDGPLGERLMAGLRRFGLRGLAFTYSGGQRVIAATKGREIRRWEDLQGLRVRTSGSPVALRLLESLGAVAVPSAAESVVPLVEAGEIDAAESTYPRYWALDQGSKLDTISETFHSMFLTCVTVSERFYHSLPESYREAMTKSVREVAVMERAQSIADGEMARRGALEKGVKIVELSQAERRRFIEKTEPMYAQFAPLFGADLLDAIRKA